MSENAMTEKYEHVELFGKAVLFTNFRIDRATVPNGWYCYDLRGSDYDPGRTISLENRVLVNHAGAILSPEQISFAKGKNYRNIKGKLNFLGDELTLAEFCEEYGLEHPVSPGEAGSFYTTKPEEEQTPPEQGMTLGGM